LKRFLILAGFCLVLLVIVLRVLQLDVLLWHSWKLNRQAMPAQAVNLSRYRADIQARVVEGIDNNLSALAYNPQRESLFGVVNGTPLIVEISLEGELLRTIAVEGVDDMEGLAHIADNLYVIAEERTHRLVLVDIPDDAERIGTAEAPSLTLGVDAEGNQGLEGVAWDQAGNRLLVVKEKDPLRVLAVTGFVNAGDGEMDVGITELKQPESDRLFMSDLSSVSVHNESGHFLLLSDESRMVVEYDQQQRPVSLLGLWRGMSGLDSTVPQAEGLTMDPQQRIYMVSEPNLFYRFTPVD